MTKPKLDKVSNLFLYSFHLFVPSTFVKPIAEFIDKLEIGSTVYNGAVCDEMDEFPSSALLFLF
jgi:hypothetical protein